MAADAARSDINIFKTEVMLLHSPKKHPPPLNVTYNGHPLEQVDEFKLLGVLLDQHLKWNRHVDLIVSLIRHDLYRSLDHRGVPSIGLLHSCDFT